MSFSFSEDHCQDDAWRAQYRSSSGITLSPASNECEEIAEPDCKEEAKPFRLGRWIHVLVALPVRRLNKATLDRPARGFKNQWQAEERRRGSIVVLIISTTVIATLVLTSLLIYDNVTLRRKIPHNDIERIVASWAHSGSTMALSSFPTDLSRDIIPKPCHSHNDYLREVPLYNALSAGCTGVEADVSLTEAGLLVGHTKDSLSLPRSLKSLYVDPLLAILTLQNPEINSTSDSTTEADATRNGVFSVDTSVTLTLLVDIKTDGATTLPVVLQELEPFRSCRWLTHWNGSALVPGPLTIVASGNTPSSLLNGDKTTHHDVFLDAPLDQLWGENAPNNNTAYTYENSNYASTSFQRTVGQLWHNKLSPSQVEIIRGQVNEARRRGLRARYWNTPSWPISLRNHVWDVLQKEGVGMLNVDDLAAASHRSWNS